MIGLSASGEIIIQWLREAPALVIVGAFFFAWIILWLPLAIPSAIALNWRPPQPLTTPQKLSLLASLYAIAPFLVWGIARLKGITPDDYGWVWLPQLWLSLLSGLGISLVGLLLLFGLQGALGWIEWNNAAAGGTVSGATSPAASDSTASDSTTTNDFPTEAVLNRQPPPFVAFFLPTLLLGLWISGTEEFVFRGFLVTELQQDYPAVITAVTSSAIFAVLHLVWEWRETLPQLPGLWLMGMVLVLARWADAGNLGLAWGLHLGWVVGIAILDTTQVITYTGRVPDWLTGVEGKPLAGLMSSLLLLGTAGCLWFIARPG